MESLPWKKVTASTDSVTHLQHLRHVGGFFPIGNRAQFTLRGKDSARYLNGQVTCDLLKLEPWQAMPACLLTAKGKLCAHVFMRQKGADLVVESEPELYEQVLERLERYIIADDVTISGECIDPGYHVFGFPPPTDILRISRLGVDGYDTSELPTNIPFAAPHEIELLRIERGMPRWGLEMDTDTFPQEARLEILSVDFGKGCYVGQEVVSRLKSVGRVNKRLFGFVGPLEESNGPCPVLHPIERPDEQAGILTSRAVHFELAQTVALGYLNRQQNHFARFTVTEPSGRVLGIVEKREFPILS